VVCLKFTYGKVDFWLSTRRLETNFWRDLSVAKFKISFIFARSHEQFWFLFDMLCAKECIRVLKLCIAWLNFDFLNQCVDLFEYGILFL